MAAAAAAAAAATSPAPSVPIHPDQRPEGDRECREVLPVVYPIRRVEGGPRAMDMARVVAADHDELPMWATDVANPDHEVSRIGTKFFTVASYGSWIDQYRGTKPAERRSYEIVRVRPTKLYADIDVDMTANPSMTQRHYVELRVLAIAAIRDVWTQLFGKASAVDVEEVVILDSTRPGKISQHLAFPNAVLRNPFHCGALIRRVRDCLMLRHETTLRRGDRDNDHMFFLWSQEKDRASPGSFVRTRTFFFDVKVYTFDRNFRIYGSRKNTERARPLFEDGNTTDTFDWSIFRKSLLQSIPSNVAVRDCLEMDNTMPRSTSDANYLRYDVVVVVGATAAAAAAAARPVGHGASVASAASTTTVFSPAESMRAHWTNVFPVDIVWYLATPHTRSGVRRQFQFVDAAGTWSRKRTFRDASALQSALQLELPQTLHVGAVEDDSTASYNPTLAFDIDITDYPMAAHRPCCRDEKKMCATCWPILIFAQEALVAFLGEYGILAPFFFFSGKKGIHAWVPPTCRRADRVACNAGARTQLLADFTSVVRTGTAVDEFLPNFQAATHIRSYVRTLLGTDDQRRKWRAFLCDDMQLRVLVERHESTHGLESAILHLLWPRLDEEVTKRPTHNIKSPYCVHPDTQRIAAWLPTTASNPYAASFNISAGIDTLKKLWHL